MHALWDRCNELMFGWIMNSLYGDLSNSIMYSPNVYLVWKYLRERYDKVNGLKLYHILKEIVLAGK